MSVSGSAASAEYLVSAVGGGRENYYTGAAAYQEPPGRWSGKLAERLGLAGDVEVGDMHKLYGSYEAPDGTKLGRAPKEYTASVEASVAAWEAAHPDALPEDVDKARRSIERAAPSACQGWDLTASATKTVSAIHAAVWRRETSSTRRLAELAESIESRRVELGVDSIEPGVDSTVDELLAESSRVESTRLAAHSTRLRIESVLARANARMLARVDSLTYTRAGAHGRAGEAGRWVKTRELAIASFFQHTSRANDPQLHTHNAILNKALDEEGEYRALDTADLNAQLHELSAIHDREVAEGLSAMGLPMVMRDTGAERPSWEVALVPQATADLFSTRRAAIKRGLEPEIQAAKERMGRDELSDVELKRLRQEVTLASRPGKSHEGESFATLLDRWHNRLVDDAATGLDPLGDEVLAAVKRGPVVEHAPERVSWSRVMSEAVTALGEKRATWRRADLFGEIEQRVPLLGSGLSADEREELLDRLTDRALGDVAQVAQVAGHEGVEVPAELGRRGMYTAPSRVRYATVGALKAEEAIRRGTSIGGRFALPAAAVGRWLDEHRPTAGRDQRAVGVGVLSSDRAVVQIVGPAGSGKSYTIGALAEAHEALSRGGRVHGLAVSQNAAEVLAEEGLTSTANIAEWLAVQDRIAAGNAGRAGLGKALGPRDLVVVDEASMVDREQVRRIYEHVVERAGARLVLAGDDAQLGSIGAGGVLGLLDGHVDTFSLSEIRRMRHAWERKASLALRERDVAAIAEYDKRGRIVDCDTTDAAEEAAARAAVAERLSRRSVVVTAATERQAQSISAAVRARLVEAGIVRPELGEVELASGLSAAVGDVVVARQNRRRLGLTNRRQYEVREVLDGGGLEAVNLASGQVVRMPAAYVAEHVDHGYAGTVHSTQGLSVKAGYSVTDGRGIDARALYVMATRGAEMNRVFVALGRERDADTPAKASEVFRDEDGEAARARSVELSRDGRQASGRAVLSRVVERSAELDASALVTAERDAEYLASASTMLGRYEHAVEVGCRRRLDADLDRLVVDGDMPEEARARMHGEEETATLARLVRACEQNGEAPYEVLRQAVTSHGFGKLNSVAAGLCGRLKRGRDLTAASATQADELPERMPAGFEEYLGKLKGVRDDRRAELGTRTAQEQPAWATSSLGPVPDEPLARLGWERRAGEVAWYREAVNFVDERRAIPDAPGIQDTEKRGAWYGAYEALGRPEAEREEASLTDGQLRARMAAYERTQRRAPAHVDDALKAQHEAAEAARIEAVEAGEGEGGVWLAEAAARRKAAEEAEEAASVRGEYLAATEAERSAYVRARRELVEVRGQAEEVEGQAMTAAEWLAADRAATAAEDPHRVVDEASVVDDERQAATAARVDELVAAEEGAHERPSVPEVEGAMRARLPAQASGEEVEEAAQRARQVAAVLDDQASEEAAATPLDVVYEVDVDGHAAEEARAELADSLTLVRE